MNRTILRPIVAPLAGAAICLMVGTWTGAAGRAPVAEQLSGRAISVAGDEDTGPVAIYIERWSTDAEFDSLRGPLAQADRTGLLQALQRYRNRAGVMLLPGVQGRGTRVRERTPKNLLLAREVQTPAGRRVLLASDQHLGLGESQLDARKEAYELSLVEIRFDANGTGIGKVLTPADVTYDRAAKRLEAKDFGALPVRLVDVKTEQQ
jgi:hypothetical protein